MFMEKNHDSNEADIAWTRDQRKSNFHEENYEGMKPKQSMRQYCSRHDSDQGNDTSEVQHLLSYKGQH